MAASTLATEVQVNTGSLTDLPGVQNVELTGIDNKSFKTGGIADAVDGNLGTGTSEPGSLKFEFLYDPADTVHKALEALHEAGGVSLGILVEISATGGTKAATVTMSKWDLKAEKHGGWMCSVEWECEGVWTTVDPA